MSAIVKSSEPKIKPLTVEELIETCGVNKRQALFALEFGIDFNGRQAAIRAGYAARSADQHASRLMTDVKVQSAIQKVQEYRRQRCEITVDDVVRQWRRLGWSDPRKLFNPDGTAKGIHELDDDTAQAIAGFEVECETTTTETAKGKKVETVVRTTKVKWADKKGVVADVARHLGMFEQGGEQGDAENKASFKVYIGVDMLEV